MAALWLCLAALLQPLCAVEFLGTCICTEKGSYCLDNMGNKVECNSDRAHKDSEGRPQRYGYCAKQWCDMPQDSSGCFPSSAYVQAFDEANYSSSWSMPIHEVRVGQHVLAVDGLGRPHRSRVNMLLHHSEAADAAYLRIHYISAAGPGILLASPGHLLARKAAAAAGGHEWVFASQLRRGDGLRVMSAGNNATTAIVTYVQESVMATGAFAPVTAEGTLVVDGVVVSCYSESASHSVAHTAVGMMQQLQQYSGLELSTSPGSGVNKHVWRLFQWAKAVLPSAWFHQHRE